MLDVANLGDIYNIYNIDRFICRLIDENSDEDDGVFKRKRF